MQSSRVTYDNTGGQAVKEAAHGSSRWWDQKVSKGKKPTSCHGDLVPYVKSLMTAWQQHDWFDRVHDRIYENRQLANLKRANAALQSAGFDTSRMMVTRNIVDTFGSRFSRRRPMPMFVVDGAEWSLKRRAQAFRKLLWGKMAETETDRKSVEALKDACIRGTGVLYIDEGDDDVIVERAHRWELFVDPHEASAGEEAVRQMHRVRRVAKEVLLAMFPDAKQAINAAPASTSRQHESSSAEWASPTSGWSTSGVIDVYESWHLPSGGDAEDGRKAICIEGATLCFEEWDRPRFPFAILRRHRRQDAFWGQGDVELLAEDQADINRIARDIQRNIEVNGHMVILTNEQQDATPVEKFTGRGPFRLKVKGDVNGVKFVMPPAVNQSALQYLEFRIGKMHAFTGVSEWAAQGRSPLGNGVSGAALDTMEDIQSDRHAEFEQAYSHWRCDIAQRILDACRSVVKRRKEDAEAAKKRGEKVKVEYGATWMQGGTLERLDWDSAAMEEDQYRLQIEPISYIPSTRAGKIAYAKELMQAGLLQRHHMLALFDEPDVAQHNKIELAPYNRALAVMEDLGDETKEAPMPEPHWDLELHLVFAKAYLQIAQNEKAPEEVLARYRDYVDAVMDAQEQAQPPAAPGAPPMDPAAAAAAGGMPPDAAMAGGGMPMDPMGGGMPPGMPPMAA